MINIDTFLKIGDSHRVCEDYIVSGDSPVPFIILSDGCSSSNNTEMGARILCHLAKQYLKYRCTDLLNLDYYKMGSWIIHNAELTARQLGLSINCLDATLIVSYELDGFVKVYMYGDGAIVTKDKDEHIRVDYVEFTNNAPYYLTYLIDEARDAIYHSNKNSKSYISEFENVVGHSQELAYDAQFFLEYRMDTYQSLFICSDGIQSFIHKDKTIMDIVSLYKTLPEMMAFKNVKGEFLKRRLKKAIKNFNDNGIVHYDDLSIGAYTRIK